VVAAKFSQLAAQRLPDPFTLKFVHNAILSTQESNVSSIQADVLQHSKLVKQRQLLLKHLHQRQRRQRQQSASKFSSSFLQEAPIRIRVDARGLFYF
jgi:hypothetical protein